MNEVQFWWDNLDSREKFELMDIVYPDHAHLLNVDEMWEGLDWEIKLDIWQRETNIQK
jgi:hypothetical protein